MPTADEPAMPTRRSKWRDRVRVAVVGEFNSGKTALVNALAGVDVLAPSFANRTLHPTVVRFAPKPSATVEWADRRRTPVTWGRLDDLASREVRRLHIGVNLQHLKGLTVIDTPGVGFADGESDRRSFLACRNADIVIWCTPAMQAWKASEERAWLTLSARVRRRGILAVTFADQVPQADATRLLARLRDEAGPHFRKVVMSEACADLVATMS